MTITDLALVSSKNRSWWDQMPSSVFICVHAKNIFVNSPKVYREGYLNRIFLWWDLVRMCFRKLTWCLVTYSFVILQINYISDFLMGIINRFLKLFYMGTLSCVFLIRKYLIIDWQLYITITDILLVSTK